MINLIGSKTIRKLKLMMRVTSAFIFFLMHTSVSGANEPEQVYIAQSSQRNDASVQLAITSTYKPFGFYKEFGFAIEHGKPNSNALDVVEYWAPGDPRRNKQWETEKNVCSSGDDYIIFFSADGWSNNYNYYEGHRSNTLWYSTGEEGLNKYLLDGENKKVGGGYGYYSIDVHPSYSGQNVPDYKEPPRYFVCISKDKIERHFLFLNPGIQKIKDSLKLYRDDPLVEPRDVRVSNSDSGYPEIHWQNSDGDTGTKVAIFRSYRKDVVTVPRDDKSWVDHEAPCNQSIGYWVASTNTEIELEENEVTDDGFIHPRSRNVFGNSQNPLYIASMVRCGTSTSGGGRYTQNIEKDPLPIPSSPTSPGGNVPSTCNRTMPGVILFKGANYQPPCTHLTASHPNLAQLTISDKGIGSIWINGSYRVRPFPEPNYGGPSDELNRSDDNTTDRSFSNIWSSIEITNLSERTNCAEATKPGVYFYRDTNFGGGGSPECYYTTGDVNDFGKTHIGDNEVSSVKIVGEWEVKLYENKNQSGRNSGTFSSSRENTNRDSLGEQISSARVRPKRVKLDIPIDERLLDNVDYNSARRAKVDYCGVGDKYYVDRDDYAITSFSNGTFNGLPCIRTANDDKYSTHDDLLQFDLTQPARIYLYIDKRIERGQLPGWMEGLFSPTGDTVDTSDNDGDGFAVYACDSQAGRINLGGLRNRDGFGAKSMYWVGLRPIDASIPTKVCAAPILPPPCPAPLLIYPQNGALTRERQLNMQWSGVSCSLSDETQPNQYLVRVSTSPDMNAGGELALEEVVSGTSYTPTFDAAWEDRDLYWSVQVANPASRAEWATVRQLRVEVNDPPIVSFDKASDEVITQNQQPIWGTLNQWRFGGTATDSDGTVEQVVVNCFGQSCNAINLPAAQDGNTWNYTRDDLLGRHDVYVYAYDDEGARNTSSDRHSIVLWVDAVPPVTGLVLNEQPHQQNATAWYREPVVVQLLAVDYGSGIGRNHARAGVQSINYKLDGGPSSTTELSQLFLDINTDGEHTLEYSAQDMVGNKEVTRIATIRVDLTPPTPPTGVTEFSGVTTGEWQSEVNVPTFSWNEGTDSGSGVWGHQLYFGTDPQGTGYTTFLAGTQQWTPRPQGVLTGQYYLRGRTRDHSGQWSPWTDLFSFYYDGTTPRQPSNVTHAAGIKDDTWQSQTAIADFTWDEEDSGIGAGQTHVYWGTDPQGMNDDQFVTNGQYKNATSLCQSGQACVGYLRLRRVDEAGNDSSQWMTAFVLRYDSVPPQLGFTINQGLDETRSSKITLNLTVTEVGSGVQQTRISNNGTNWSNWEPFAEERSWQIPAINGQSATVYLQVRDGAGLESSVAQQTIRLNISPNGANSANYHLFNDNWPGGAQQTQSTNYMMGGSFDPMAYPLILQGEQYQVLNGFAPMDIPVVDDGTIPELPPTLPVANCTTPYIRINDDAPFATTSEVILQLCAPNTIEMRLSNNIAFTNSQWETYAVTKTWNLQPNGESVQPHFVYAAFRQRDGSIRSVYYDEVIYDPLPPQPSVSSLVAASSLDGWATIQAQSDDTLLPVVGPGPVNLFEYGLAEDGDAAQVQVSENSDFAGAVWQEYSSNISWIPAAGDGERVVYVRMRDAAGNVSDAITFAFMLDTTPPNGGIVLGDQIIGPNMDTLTVYFSAEDLHSKVTEMRVSTDPFFGATVWRPYTSTLEMPAYFPAEGSLTIYVQYRDQADNLSAVYGDDYFVDSTPPSVTLEVVPGSGATRTIYILAADDYSQPTSLFISNDPLILRELPGQAYNSEIEWTFDEREVVWVQVEDSVGNRSEAVPAFAWSTDELPQQQQRLFMPSVSTQSSNGQLPDVDGSNVLFIPRLSQ